MAYALEGTEQNFETEVMQSPLPVLLDFWAPWCGPCRMVAPAIEEIAKEYQGKLKVVKVNTDEHPALSAKFGIRSIPTIGIIKNGKVVDGVIGAVQKKYLIEKITPYL